MTPEDSTPTPDAVPETLASEVSAQPDAAIASENSVAPPPLSAANTEAVTEAFTQQESTDSSGVNLTFNGGMGTGEVKVALAVPEAALAPPPPPLVPALPPQPVPQVAAAPQPHDLSRIAQDLQIRKAQVEAVVTLLDEGNTVPFMTRYRKERTGGLDEVQIRRIQDRVGQLRDIAAKKQTILRSIANQGRLNDDLVEAIFAAEHPKRLDDLYLPFKPKKKTLASEAREKGLEPLALAIWTRDPAVENLAEVIPGIVDPWKQLHDEDDVRKGVRYIIAEIVAELAEVRGPLRAFLWDTVLLAATKVETVPDGKGAEYRDYFQFKEHARQIPPHRVLAINRGEREQILRVRLEWDDARVRDIVLSNLTLSDHPHRDFIFPAVEDALTRLVLPSLEREIRRELTEFSQDHAVDIFSRNLRSLLMRPPLGGKKVLAIDPGQRTGCKLAVLDETGVLIEEAVIYPHQPQKKTAEAKRKLEQLIRKYQTSVVAIGNGTACRETEQVVADLIADFEQRRLNPAPATSPIEAVSTSTATATMPVEAPTEPAPSEPTSIEAFTVSTVPGMGAETTLVLPGLAEGSTAEITSGMHPAAETTSMPTPAAKPVVAHSPPAPVVDLTGLPDAPVDLAYVIVNEAGASDYSASPIAKEEFPNLDATTRGTISIGRRLQDPLSELVKVDPQHIGVGLYQHDVRAKYLKQSVESVIESCVNGVGVDLNTASVPLLRHVSGLNQLTAREVVEYRKANGPFKTREQLRSVSHLGDIRFTQAAGFLKIPDGDDPLDNTAVHPESYPLVRTILQELGFEPADLRDKQKLVALRAKLNEVNADEIAAKHDVGLPTLIDTFHALARPGRDPREDHPEPIFRKGIIKLEDLVAGMELKGEVLNVVDFGAFVDVGLKDSGLVHISQMANRYIKSPYDVIAVGDVVSVWVMAVDAERKRVSLSMIQPGQERRAQGRPPQGERPMREDRPPQGERPPQQRQDRPPQGDRPPQQRQDRPPQGQGDRPPQQRQDRPPQGPRPGFQPRPDGAQPAGDRPPPRQFGPRPSGPARRPQGPGAPGWRSAPKTEAPPVRPVEAAPAEPTPVKKQKTKVVKVSADQKAGKEPVYSFAQLAALFTTPQEPPAAVKPPELVPAPQPSEAPPQSPPAETPPA